MSEDTATLRRLNEAAVREHALKCSQQFRAGKFTRVGQDFLDELKTDVAFFVRELRHQKYATSLHDPLDPVELQFVTAALMDEVKEALNLAIGRMIQNKVQRQPTCGCTLGRTR